MEKEFEKKPELELELNEPFALVEVLENFDLATVEKYEIRDEVLVKHLDQALPAVRKLLKNQVKADGQLFKIDIPLNKLAEAKGEVGKYRAIVIKNGRIAENAKLIPVQPNQVTAAVSNVMGVASIAVGQYYMAVIEKQLENINNNLDKIKEFQEQEFKGKIRSLLTNIANLAKFSEEYAVSDKIISWKLNELSNYRKQTTDLLEQVNGTLEKYFTHSKKLDFKTYRSLLLELQKLLSFQDVLLQILKEIARLEQVFLQGETSVQSSYKLYQSYSEEINDRNKKISAWQNHYSKQFKINIKKRRRHQDGALGVVANIAKDWNKNAEKAGVIGGIGFGMLGGVAGFGGGKLAGELHKQIAYIPLEKNLITAINQVNKLSKKKHPEQIKFHKDNVQLLVSDDKVYYLADNK